MTTRIKIRRDSSSNWSTVNPILALGELGLDTTLNKLKVGDGTTHWTSLNFIHDGADTGSISFNGTWIHNIGSGDIYISPQDGNTWLYLPSDSQAGSETVDLANVDDNGVVTISTHNHQWAFDSTGKLNVPENAGIDINWTSDTAGSGSDGHYDSARINNDHANGLYITNTMDGTPSTWLFGKEGNLTLPSNSSAINYANGASILSGLGVSSINGGLADNSAGITITTYTLATDTGEYDNSGSVTYNIASEGALTAGVIIKGLTVGHTQTITGDYNQGDNTVSWGQSGIDYELWDQVASVTAFVTDSRGYTFYTVVQDSWDVPHGPCLVEGTQVTMADGSHKAIEDIQHGELVRVWNFDLGEFSEAQPIWIKVAEETTGHNVYTFSDGTKLRTVGHHVFNKEAGKFTKLKYKDTPIGTTTFNEKGEEVTLLSKERVTEPTRYYNVWTQYHLNLFADGILTSNRFNNTYPIVDMKFVKDDRKLRDISEFAGIDEKYISGLRLQEQSQEYTAQYISDYVHNRLERLDIANQTTQEV